MIKIVMAALILTIVSCIIKTDDNWIAHGLKVEGEIVVVT